MRKYIITLCIVLCILLTGCSKVKITSDTTQRFVVEYSELSSGSGYRMTVINDTETGIRYLFVKSGYGGGLTRLVEVDE